MRASAPRNWPVDLLVVTIEAPISLRRGPGLAIWAKQNCAAGSPSSQRPARYTAGWKSWSALYWVSGVVLTL